MTSKTEDLRRRTNPLFGDRKLKLGTFGQNLDRGCAITTIDGVLEINWPNTMTIAKLADEMEFEALVPVGRWKGFGGTTNFNGPNFECFSWAAGVGALTRHPAVFSTSHVMTIHPVMAAKQAATIDHITGGRFALNIVTGWHRAEMEMFGTPLLDHDIRYALSVEWLEVVKRLWTEEEEFDFEGKYFQVKKGYLAPKPIQKPFPAVMNAGHSETGRRYAAKYCDMAFVNINRDDIEASKAVIGSYRKLAREEYGRELQIWASCYVVQGETQADAQDYFDEYVHEKGDWVAATNLVESLGLAGSRSPEMLKNMKTHFVGGWGGYPLIGSREQIVDGFGRLSAMGLDGVVLSWPRYIEDMRWFQQEIYPLMQQAGLR